MFFMKPCILKPRIWGIVIQRNEGIIIRRTLFLDRVTNSQCQSGIVSVFCFFSLTPIQCLTFRTTAHRKLNAEEAIRV